MSTKDKWKQPAAPPPPLFLGQKERDLVKQVNDEVTEKIVGQTVLYYPIDIGRTNFHSLYGEAVEKTFLPPIRVYAMVKYQNQTTSVTSYGIERIQKITVLFHKRRLSEDQDMFVREGDFVQHGDMHYEITSLTEPKWLFGQAENSFEIQASCIRSRESLFNAQ